MANKWLIKQTVKSNHVVLLGAGASRAASKREMQAGSDIHQTERVENIFFDCADGIGCNE